MTSNNSFNTAFVETERLNLHSSSGSSFNGNVESSSQMNAEDLNSTTHKFGQLLDSDYYDENAKNNKFNSFPMRQKKPSASTASGTKLKPAPKSTSSIQNPRQDQYINLTQEELGLTVKMARTRRQEADRLKHLIRNNCWPANHPIRKYLWKCLLELSSNPSGNNNNNSNILDSNKENNNNFALNHSNNNSSSSNGNNRIDFNANETEYNKHLNQIFGKLRDIDFSLPDFVNINEKTSSTNLLSATSLNHQNQLGSSPTSHHHSAPSSPSTNHLNHNHLNYHFLNTKGKQAIKRILCVYEYHYPQVTYNPGLISISSLLLHYMQEHEVFAALCFMSSTKEHLIDSKASWDTACSVFTRLLKSYCKSSYEIISKYATDSLENIFNEWYWWIFDCLSFEYQVKIMDCYLYEGLKVLYRVSLAIVQQFSKYLELIEEYEYAGDFFFDVVKSENIKVNKDSIKQFCESTHLESIEKLLKVSFSIRNLKRSTIKDFYTKEETKRKNFGTTLQQSSNTTTNPTQLKALNNIENNQNSPSRIFLNEAATSVLSHAHLCTLWNWIPQRLTVYSPNMLFTTQEHGTSINTLFNVLDELEYCFLVIKTFQNEIFGAFCAGNWNERKQKKLYFGTGETFLFSLVPEKRNYKWVGTRLEKMTTNQEMFLRADVNKIVIGGGGRDGLSISSNLLEGTTNHCDTFENEPLSSQTSFQIAILEIVGFGNGRN